MATGKDPLSQYAAIRTSQLEELERQLREIYGATGFEVPNRTRLNVRGNFVRLHDTALGFGACGTFARICFGDADFARFQLPLRGRGVTRSGKFSTEVSVSRPSLTSAGQPTVLDFGADFEHLFLRVGSDALERKLSALLGRPIQRRLEFALAEFTNPAMLTSLVRMIELLTDQLDNEDAELSSLAYREMEQAIIVQLLMTSRHKMSAFLDQDPKEDTVDHVRRVEAYIEANWERPVTIEDLVEIAGVSARTLFRTFEKQRGCSPIAFAKKIRLERSRDLLCEPDQATSVSDVAKACGFSNLGHFSRDYRNTFGELPSQTLIRSKARF